MIDQFYLVDVTLIKLLSQLHGDVDALANIWLVG